MVDPLRCSLASLFHHPKWQKYPDLCNCNRPDGAFHSWNCNTSPIYAQVMRDLDFNPWTCSWNYLYDLDIKWEWEYCLLCRGCGQDKDIGAHGMSEYGGCV